MRGATKFITIKKISTILLLLFLLACNNTKTQNRLSKASSPYLREHADNPVDWYEWSDEAIAKAKKENKPLLISIGYASCHWCHVMEKESFMDTAVARIMNENFVNIKVDREERPDIDNIYMNACQLLTGNGGWPLNAFALPDGKPFFAGTFYPKESWINLLRQIAKAYKEQNKKVLLQADALTNGIADNELSLVNNNKQQAIVTQKFYQSLFDSTYKKVDIDNGGLKGYPKFPMPSLWEFMLQYQYLTGNKAALDATVNTLTKMASGGIYDHVGGGFARYSTDSLWRVPHFEKMLYDNGQLMSLYSHAYQVTKNELFKNVVFEIAAFVERDLTSPEGGFYSSLNADTEEGEGAFYAWTYNDVKKIIGDKIYDPIFSYFNISQKGNLPAAQAGWEKNQNILFASQTPTEFALINKLSPVGFDTILINTKKTLLTERNKRVKPSTDDKILTSWNALMLKGYIDAYTAFGDQSFLKMALLNAVFLEKNLMSADGHLFRNYKDGKSSINAFLDDYALLAKTFISLYQVTFNKHWLMLSKQLTDYTIKNFYDDKSGIFFYTSANSEKLVVRKVEISDNVIPSSNAIMAEVLFDLDVYFENKEYKGKSSRMLSALTGQMNSGTVYYSQWCFLAGMFSHGTYEIAIMGKDAIQKNMALQKDYLPQCVFMGGPDEENLPLLENKMKADKTLIYVCTNKTCKLPVEEISMALKQINNK